MNYYKQSFHIEYRDNYHDGWLKAEADLLSGNYIKIRDNFNAKSKVKPDTLGSYYYDNGYFCYLCQYASDNKLL